MFECVFIQAVHLDIHYGVSQAERRDSGTATRTQLSPKKEEKEKKKTPTMSHDELFIMNFS